MQVLIFGKDGQLAWELQRQVPDGISLQALGLDTLDVTDHQALRDVFKTYSPDCVINATAHTAVDKAESESDLAYAVNADAVKVMAALCKDNGTRFIHVSTDFVFSGGHNTPYTPEAPPEPLGVYGASKLAGENAVIAALPDSSVIVRTAWVYSAHGNNFVKTMLRLMVAKPELGVIYDQVGTPTWAKGLAQWIWSVVEKPDVSGLFHWTDEGVASWYDFAVAIQELALEKGLLDRAVPIKAIPATDYPLPARRPAYSVLDKTSAKAVSGLRGVHWRTQLSNMLDELKQHG